MDYIQLLDRRQEKRLRDIHLDRPGILFCRSPWLLPDINGTPDKYLLGVRIGVNFTVEFLDHLDYCFAGDPAFWERVDPREYPDTLFLTGMNPGAPRNTGGNVTDFKITRLKSTVNSIAALWFAWYVGANPIRINGAHFAIHPEGEFYGDIGLQDQMPDAMKRRQYLVQQQGRLPFMAREFITTVETMRKLGRNIDWPGEGMAREVNHLGNAHPQEQLLLEPTIKRISRGYENEQALERTLP